MSAGSLLDFFTRKRQRCVQELQFCFPGDNSTAMQQVHIECVSDLIRDGFDTYYEVDGAYVMTAWYERALVSLFKSFAPVAYVEKESTYVRAANLENSDTWAARITEDQVILKSEVDDHAATDKAVLLLRRSFIAHHDAAEVYGPFFRPLHHHAADKSPMSIMTSDRGAVEAFALLRWRISRNLKAHLRWICQDAVLLAPYLRRFGQELHNNVEVIVMADHFYAARMTWQKDISIVKGIRPGASLQSTLQDFWPQDSTKVIGESDIARCILNAFLNLS